jgi:hypothetical protein
VKTVNISEAKDAKISRIFDGTLELLKIVAVI